MVSNVHEVNYKTFRGISRLPSFLRNRLNTILIKKIKRICGVDFDVVWSFDAFRFQNLELWNASVSIYHAVDIHAAPLEKELLSTAHLILSVSDRIKAKLTLNGRSIEKVGHGVAPHFLTNQDATEARDENGHVNVGYVGNLDNWCIDNDTLLKIVADNPFVTFTFLGPYSNGSRLAKELSELKNTRLVGRVASEELPKWLNVMDMFLMCYDGANVAVNSNHHKILEFLSTGKATVINYTDEYKDKSDLVIMSKANEELPELFKSVCSDLQRYNHPDLVKLRKEYAALNGYGKHLERIDDLIRSLL